jgi:hypothetical protein
VAPVLIASAQEDRVAQNADITVPASWRVIQEVKENAHTAADMAGSLVVSVPAGAVP